LNKKLRHLPATETDVFEGVQSIVQQPLIIEPKFSNYTDLKISTARFQIKDAIIEQGGDVELRTNLVICNGANLTIVRDGDLHAVNGDIQIRENSSIEVYGNLIIEEGAQLKLRENTIIYLRKGAALVISEGATLSTEGNAIIELHPEATFEVAGEDNQRILEKVIKRM